MKFARWVLILLATLVLNASATDIAGTWKVMYAGPLGTGPKTIGSIILILQSDGNAVTGTARIGAWPGDAPVVDGKFDGGQITFAATGTRTSTTGIPTCRFVVTLNGDEMDVTMTVIKNPGGPLRADRNYEYKGKRIS